MPLLFLQCVMLLTCAGAGLEDGCQAGRCNVVDEVSLIQVATHFSPNSATAGVNRTAKRNASLLPNSLTGRVDHVATRKLSSHSVSSPPTHCGNFVLQGDACFAGPPIKVMSASFEECCSTASAGKSLFNYFEANSTCQLVGGFNFGFFKCDGKLGYPNLMHTRTNIQPSLYNSALLTKHRPPHQTAAQAAAMQNVESQAPIASAAAKEWVVDYMGSIAVRSRLHKSLQNYSNQDLLDAFIWEFKRLAIFHTAPASEADEDLADDQLLDDTNLRVSLRNGYIQNPCTRYMIGGPQPLYNLFPYWKMFDRFGVHVPLGLTSLRQANDCMLFNANNLRKASSGNYYFGGFSYVLNPSTMHGRLMWEAFDAGMTIELHKNLTPPVYPGYGTHDDFLHLVKPHEEMWNMPGPRNMLREGVPDLCCNYSLALLLNRWLVPGTPVPTAETGGTIFMQRAPYFEVMTAGSVWLPEDLLYSIAQFSNHTGPYAKPYEEGFGKSAGLFGTPLARELREFCIKNKRPLVWSNAGLDGSGVMLLDPIVGNFGGERITEKDKELFTTWTDTTASGFGMLAAKAPPHLHFRYQSYSLRHICAQAESNPRNQVMGIDGDNNCVYWVQSFPANSGKWEVLNDGTCVRSHSERAVHTSHAECLSANSKWSCVTNADAAYPGAHYCAPSPHGTFKSADECEAQCGLKVAMYSERDQSCSVSTLVLRLLTVLAFAAYH